MADFEPNQAIQTLLGEGPTKGDGQMQTPTAKHVLAFMAKSLSFHLNEALWAGVRNANGDTTMDLFDGFDTITRKEIEAENISVAKGNYLKLTEKITRANACDVFNDYFGTLRNTDVVPEEVVIEVDAHTANYLRTLPLHHSQKEVEQTQKRSVFSYHIAPTLDFIQELRIQGQCLKVLKPQWLAERFKKDAQETVQLYE